MFTWKRPNKDAMREIATEKISSTIFKTILTFPSNSCLCLKQLLENKAIGRDAFVIAVENNEEVFTPLKRFLKANFDKYYLHEGPVNSFNNIKEVLNGKKIDYTFFDTCNTLEQNIIWWLHRKQDVFAEGCRAVFTFSIHFRRPKFSKFVWKKLNNRMTNEMSALLLEAKTNALSFISGTDAMKAVQITCQLLHLGLNKFDIGFEQVLQYSDTITPMSLIVTRLFNKQEEEKNSILKDMMLKWNRKVIGPSKVSYCTPRKEKTKKLGRPKKTKVYKFNFYEFFGRPTHKKLEDPKIIAEIRRKTDEHDRDFHRVYAGMNCGATKMLKKRREKRLVKKS